VVRTLMLGSTHNKRLQVTPTLEGYLASSIEWRKRGWRG